MDERALLAGMVTMPGMIFQLLDEQKIVPLARSVAFLQERLDEAPADSKKNGAAFPIQVALAHLLALAQPPNPTRPKEGWKPVVLPGGKQ